MNGILLSIILEESLLKNLKKNAHKDGTSLDKYIAKILKEFINAK
jgi:predicted DNA binding CopG/RHH family protein